MTTSSSNSETYPGRSCSIPQLLHAAQRMSRFVKGASRTVGMARQTSETRFPQDCHDCEPGRGERPRAGRVRSAPSGQVHQELVRTHQPDPT